MSESGKEHPATRVVRDAWKRTERARAAAEIPFVIWQAGGGPVPAPVRTDVPSQQRVEWRVQDRSEIERVQELQQQWADHEQQRLEDEARKPVDRPARKHDRQRDRG